MAILQRITDVLGFGDGGQDASEVEEQTDTFGIEEGTDYEMGEDPASQFDTYVPDEVAAKDGLTDVKGIGRTRANELTDAGYKDATDLYYASDSNLTDVYGIGEYAVGQIRDDIGGIDQNPNGESTEEAEEDSQDSTDEDDTSQQFSSNEAGASEGGNSNDESDGSDSG